MLFCNYFPFSFYSFILLFIISSFLPSSLFFFLIKTNINFKIYYSKIELKFLFIIN